MAGYMIEAFPIGAKVTIAQSDIEATVRSVCVNPGNAIQYQLVWWDGSTRKTEWLDAFEVHPVGENIPIRIGFHTTADGN